MKQVNVSDLNTDLSELVRLLKENQDELAVRLDNGELLLRLDPQKAGEKPTRTVRKRRAGIAKGEFVIPDDFFGAMDREVEEMFGDTL